jgi:ABC-type antimicrobial peptide transport system permease subunit
VIVAILLIYSLLMISVETKTLEIGILRILGLKKIGLVGMILTQASIFVLPAVVCGFIMAYPVIYLLYSTLFSATLGYTP